MMELRRVSGEKWQLETAAEDVYDELVVKDKIFPSKYHLFAAGLAYGLLHGKRHNKKPTHAFTKLHMIGDDAIGRVIDVVFWVLKDGRGDSEVWAEMLRIADGGVLEMGKMYRTSGDINIPRLLDECHRLWPSRAKDLSNVNAG